MNYKFIIEGREETNISKSAKEWFYEIVLNGEPGPFTCVAVDNKTNAILLVKPNDSPQLELFK